jgi:hypothetical protein
MARINDNHDARSASLVRNAPVNFIICDGLCVCAQDCFIIAVRFITGSNVWDIETVRTHAENDGGTLRLFHKILQ